MVQRYDCWKIIFMLLPESVRWVRYAWHGAARFSLVNYRITNDPMFHGTTRSNLVGDPRKGLVAVHISICIHVGPSGIVPGHLCRSRGNLPVLKILIGSWKLVGHILETCWTHISIVQMRVHRVLEPVSMTSFRGSFLTFSTTYYHYINVARVCMENH